jgi:hypothetical protein
MIFQSDIDRAEILKLVGKGELSPGDAEKRAKNWGLPPFSTGPSLVAIHLGDVKMWTLAQAAAWFIWRDLEAVHHQTVQAREEWKVWDPIPKKKDLRGSPKRAAMVNPFGETPYRLVEIGAARIWRVFHEARWDPTVARWVRYSRQHAAVRPSNPNNDLPFQRFRTALQSGRLSVINKEGRQGKGSVETADYWAKYLDRYVFPAFDRPPFVQENAYYIPMHEVIKAELEISQSEIEQPILDLQHAVGWAAYQKHFSFRSLSRDDVKGKGYYDQLYKSDFLFLRPDLILYEALLDQKLKCFNKGVEITRAELMNLASIWDAPDVQFLRKDLLTLWPDNSAAVEAPEVVGPPPFAGFEEQSTGKKAPVETDSASPVPKRGPKPEKRNKVVARMLEDLRSKAITPEGLREMLGKEKVDRYGIDASSSERYSPTTMGDAQTEAIAIFRSSNSDK